MSKDATTQLAKATWILPLLYIFGNRFIGRVIGPAIADFLVFVLAVVMIPVAVYCLAQIRVHGPRGIRGHAVVGILLSILLLAIWIPNFLAARARARAAGRAGQPVGFRVATKTALSSSSKRLGCA